MSNDGTEEEGADKIVQRKVCSRRFPPKVMFMGAVGKPDMRKGRNFDGRIFKKRISRLKKLQRGTATQNFSDNRSINYILKTGEWQSLYVPAGDQSYAEFLQTIVDVYSLEDDIAARLNVKYETFSGATKKIKYKNSDTRHCILDFTLQPKDETRRQGTSYDLELCIKFTKREEVEEDVSCDSTFVLEMMDKLGKSIRQQYHWVPLTEEIFLQIDNAGGHGTYEAIEKYKAYLKDKYNGIVKFKPPSSPEINACDLGFWMSLQATVQKLHRHRTEKNDAIARIVLEAWEQYPAQKLTNIFNRVKTVMHCIIADNCSNQLVEKRFKKLTNTPEEIIEEPIEVIIQVNDLTSPTPAPAPLPQSLVTPSPPPSPGEVALFQSPF